MGRFDQVRAFLVLAAAAMALGLPSTSAADTTATTGTAAANAIAAKCAVDFATCMGAFDHYARSEVETNVTGGFTLPWVKASDQTFFGYAQELYYTELTVGSIQYQVGFGYIVTAHQQDAKPTASGAFSGVDVSGGVEVGDTSFSTSLIGLAPIEATNCAATVSTTAYDQKLLCAVNIHPNVTQDYFRGVLAGMSGAMREWMVNPPAYVSGKWSVCPQVIAYRSIDPTTKGKPLVLTEEQKTAAEDIQKALSANCAASLPSAHVYYKNGAPLGVSSADLSVAGGTANADHTVISQGYFRNKIYLAGTRWGWPGLYDPTDQYSEVYVDGLSAAASLPSVLAAIVTLSSSVDDQRLYVHTFCSGGAKSVTATPFSTAAADPVAEANAYGALFDGLRAGADTPGAKC